MFAASGFFQQQLTLVQVSDLHFVVSMHGVTELNGQYPDGRHVAFNSTMNIFETLNIDPISFETGVAVLSSAIVVTFTQHDGLHVQGTGGAPDESYDTVTHATYTPDLKLASYVVEYRSGCK